MVESGPAKLESSLACCTYRLSRIRNSVGRLVPSYPWAYTFRPSKGKTSISEIFWLIPAIRRKERKGPGITTSAVATTPGAAADCEEPAPAARGPRGPEHHREEIQPRETSTTPSTQRGNFTAGFLSEPMR